MQREIPIKNQNFPLFSFHTHIWWWWSYTCAFSQCAWHALRCDAMQSIVQLECSAHMYTCLFVRSFFRLFISKCYNAFCCCCCRRRRCRRLVLTYWPVLKLKMLNMQSHNIYTQIKVPQIGCRRSFHILFDRVRLSLSLYFPIRSVVRGVCADSLLSSFSFSSLNRFLSIPSSRWSVNETLKASETRDCSVCVHIWSAPALVVMLQ